MLTSNDSLNQISMSQYQPVNTNFYETLSTTKGGATTAAPHLRVDLNTPPPNDSRRGGTSYNSDLQQAMFICQPFSNISNIRETDQEDEYSIEYGCGNNGSGFGKC